MDLSLLIHGALFATVIGLLLHILGLVITELRRAK